MFVHDIDPVLVHLGPIAIRYYGLFYIIGFFASYFLISWLAKEKHIHFSRDEVIDYITYIAVGVIAGARIFYCFVYNPMYYLPRLWEIFFVWQGGMSFHGGLIGGFLAALYFSRKYKKDFFDIADLSAMPIAFGLFLGRLGNFINSELVGRPTNLSWCFKFPKYDDLCRHPSQIYESVKNLGIVFALFFLRNKKMRKGSLFGLFLLFYSALRFSVEFVREPDAQLGFIAFGLSMGQLLSILMFLFGIGWFYYIYRINKERK